MKETHSLRHRFLKSALPVIALVLLVQFCLSLAYIHFKSRQYFTDNLTQIAEGFENILIVQIGQNNSKLINATLESLSNQPLIHSVQLTVDGKEWLKTSAKSRNAVNTMMSDSLSLYRLNETTGESIYVGKLTLFADADKINSVLIQQYFLVFVEVAALFAVLCLTLYYLAGKTFGTPLAKLYKQLKSGEPTVTTLNWNYPDEIGQLVNSHNQLASQVFDLNNKLVKSEEYHRQQSVIARNEASAANKKTINSLKHFQSIYENALNGLFSTDASYRFIASNVALAHMLGFESVDEFMKDTPTILSRINPDSGKKHEIEKLMRAEGHVNAIEVKMEAKGGKSVWCILSLQEVPKNDDHIYIQGSLIDITERKQRELSEGETRAKQLASEAKSNFLANMSHEIRTPLTTIRGYSELLLDNETNELKTDRINTVLKCSNHLLRVIDDILDVSKIEADELQIDNTRFNFIELIDDTAQAFKAKAGTKGLDFAVNYRWPLPESIVADESRIKQILYILLNNAIKFTKEGQIGFDVALDPAEEKIKISVSDTGIGISQDLMTKLFSPFTQADTSTSRLHGGAGLGLHIAQKLAHMMDGEIIVQSVPDMGSRFTFACMAGSFGDLELIDNAEQAGLIAHKKAAETDLPKLTGNVLLAEDNLDNQALISLLIQGVGLNVKVANNGKMAINVIEKYGLDHFGAILMDIQMPVLNGVQATERIRKMGYDNPIVALTANVMKEEVSHYLTSGFTSHLAKPIDRQKFYEALSELFPACESGARETDHPRTAPADEEEVSDENEGLKFEGNILLADADNDTLARLCEVMNYYGLQYDSFNDGMKAYDAIKGKSYNIAIVDRNLPVINGVLFAQTLQSDGIEIPLYILTDNTSEEVLESFFSCGCDGYIEKPIDRDAIYHSLKKHLLTQKSKKKPADEKILSNALKDPGMRPLIENFLKRLPTQVQEGKSALSKEDWGKLKSTVHTIKGTGGSFGYPGLTERAKSIEDAVIEQQFDDLSRLYSELENYSNKMVEHGLGDFA